MSPLQVFLSQLSEFTYRLQYVVAILVAHFDMCPEAGYGGQSGVVCRNVLERLQSGLHCAFEYSDVAGKHGITRIRRGREFVFGCHV